MNILAFDPGPVESAWVHFETVAGLLVAFGFEPNERILVRIKSAYSNGIVRVVCEGIGHYGTGMAVGAEVFDTCEWIGRFLQVATDASLGFEKIKRHQIKMALCQSMQAKDTNIRQALIDRFGPGKDKAIGTKKAPGPLYGVHDHVWSALAVAVTRAETQGAKPVAEKCE